MIDYLERIRATDTSINRTYQIQEITGGLKDAAKDFGIPVVLLVQINRGVESRDDKRPQLSDLKDLGAIEQDADAVLLLYRHAYYLKSARPMQKTGEDPGHYESRVDQWQREIEESEREAEANVAKLRQGETGPVALHFDPVRQAFNAPMPGTFARRDAA